MKKLMILIAALAFVAGSCSKDDDDKKLFTMGKDARPTEWRIPNYNDYEQLMSVEVQLQDELQQYASYGDLLCAIIHEEVRGVAEPEQNSDGQWYFSMTIGSNTANAPILLGYYCEKLRRIYYIDWTNFDMSLPPTGEGPIYKPQFVLVEK